MSGDTWAVYRYDYPPGQTEPSARVLIASQRSQIDAFNLCNQYNGDEGAYNEQPKGGYRVFKAEPEGSQ